MDDIFFEDLSVGKKLKSSVGRTVTDADNIWFTLLTNNNNQIHFNKDYVERTFPGSPFNGKMVINGFFTLSTVSGLLVDQTSAHGFMLGIDEMKFYKPLFAGDTIYAECEVIEKRESKSDPSQGIIKIRTWGRNQRNEKIVEFVRAIMVKKKTVI